MDAHEASQFREGNSDPGFDRRPSFDAIMIDAVGNLRKLLEILERKPHWISDEAAYFERPLPTHALVPHRYRRCDEVARQLVTGLVGARLHNIHRGMAEKLSFHYEILSFGVLQQLVRRLGSARVA